MPRRFNYTGRKKIVQADARFRLEGRGEFLRFAASLELADYKLDSKGRIFIEAYRGSTASWKRFAFGTVQAPVLPMTGSLAEFDDPDGILFRVLVTVEEDGVGRLLAKADQLKPHAEGEQQDPTKSLLSTKTLELYGEAWRLDFSDGLPTLLIDPKVGGKDFALNPIFRAIASPVILRQILTEYVLVDDTDPTAEDDAESIRCRWIRFAERLTGSKYQFDDTEDEHREWIDSTVAAFANKTNVVNLFAATIATENPS